MARIERVSTTQPVAIEQAQLVDPGAFRFGDFSAQELKVIGGTLEELVNRHRAAQDSLSKSTAIKSRDLAKSQMKQFMVDNPDPDTWSDGMGKILADQQKIYLKQKFSAEAKANEDIEQEAFAKKFTIDTGIVTTIKSIDNAIKASGANVIDKISNDNGTPEAAQDVAIAIDQYQADLNRKLPKELAALQMEETLKEAQKLQIDNVKRDLMDRAAANPQLITSFLDAELKERKKGKKGLDEFKLLSNTELESIRDYAGSVGEKSVTDSTIAVNAAIEDSYAKIINKDTDITSMIAEIQANPAISEEDSAKAADKIVTFFSKWNSAKVADVTNDDVYDELLQASELVERGAMSPAAFEELYADKKGELDSDDQRTMRSKDIVATKTMQNRAFSDAMTFTMPTLVERTESEMQSLLLARQNAEVIKDIASVNLFNISIKKNQAERWNFGRFRKELRSQIDQNPEWSQKQIFTAQEILVDQLDIPVDQLLKDFDAQNPDKAIMKTPPNIEFKDIWPDLSIDDKAKIWELTMRGASADVILAEIE